MPVIGFLSSGPKNASEGLLRGHPYACAWF
jgi:hypothetical protein